MPPDVLLALASSGITLVASLMFLAHDGQGTDAEPVGEEVSFCLPPARGAVGPPPLRGPDIALRMTLFDGALTLEPGDDEWTITLASTPLADGPALALDDDGATVGVAHDLRWSGRAGVPRAVRRTWKQKVGRA